MCLNSWERTQKRDPNNFFLRGDFGVKKGAPNGFLFFLPLTIPTGPGFGSDGSSEESVFSALLYLQTPERKVQLRLPFRFLKTGPGGSGSVPWKRGSGGFSVSGFGSVAGPSCLCWPLSCFSQAAVDIAADGAPLYHNMPPVAGAQLLDEQAQGKKCIHGQSEQG